MLQKSRGRLIQQQQLQTDQSFVHTPLIAGAIYARICDLSLHVCDVRLIIILMMNYTIIFRISFTCSSDRPRKMNVGCVTVYVFVRVYVAPSGVKMCISRLHIGRLHIGRLHIILKK